MSSIKYLTLVLVFICIVNLSSAARSKPKGNIPCSEQLKEVDRVFKVLLLMSENRLLPSDDPKHSEYCKDVTSLGKRVSRYSKCEKPFAGQVLTILSNGVKKPIKYICNERKEVSKVAFACMTDSFVNKLNAKQAYLVKNLKYITQNASRSDALALFCCSMVDFLNDLSKLGTDKCSSNSIHTGEFIHDRIHSGTIDVLDLVCSTHKNVKTCEDKIGPMMNILRTPPPPGFSTNKEPFSAYFIGAVTKMA